MPNLARPRFHATILAKQERMKSEVPHSLLCQSYFTHALCFSSGTFKRIMKNETMTCDKHLFVDELYTFCSGHPWKDCQQDEDPHESHHFKLDPLPLYATP